MISKHIHKLLKNNAFTLAEILITLGVIGVVAAITIVNLLKNSSDIELITLFKNNYSILSNAYSQIVSDGGGEIDNRLYSGKNSSSASLSIRDVLCEKLNCVETCSSGQDCFYKTENEFENYNGSNTGWVSLLGYYNAKLNNGAMISVNIVNPTFSGASAVPNLHGTGGWITIDTNGFKKPNRMGRDIFRIWVYRDGIMADGVYIDQGYCSSTGTNSTNGVGCGALILQNKSLP